MRRILGDRVAPFLLPAMAMLALVAGTSVYVLDRTPGSAWLLPAAWQAAAPTGWFGSVGLWLPSLVHAFAFSVLTACLLPRRRAAAAGACAAWACVDTLAECAQHPAWSAPVAAALERAFDGSRIAAQTGQYFVRGSFDIADVIAGLAGSALAFAALSRFFVQRAPTGQARPPSHHRTVAPRDPGGDPS